MRPELLILTNERDFACDDVIRRIDPKAVAVRRLNIEDAMAQPIRLAVGGDEPSKVVWWRQFYRLNVPASMAAIDDLIVQRRQWSAWLETLNSQSSTWVNPIRAARRAENKVVQLRTATLVGFEVPFTLITNSRTEAHEFQNCSGPSIVKSLTAAHFEFSGGAFVFTRPLDEALTYSESDWLAQPVIVQGEVLGEFDARVIAFGEYSLGAVTTRESTDWRSRGDAVWHRLDVPPLITSACRAYLDKSDLRYGAFDFVVADGRWWFLECNQGGEWGWLDRQADMDVAGKLADYLTRLTY